MQILSEKNFAPFHVTPSDTLNITFTDLNGVATQLETFAFDDYQIIDKVVIVRLDNEYGFLNGVGALIGKSV